MRVEMGVVTGGANNKWPEFAANPPRSPVIYYSHHLTGRPPESESETPYIQIYELPHHHLGNIYPQAENFFKGPETIMTDAMGRLSAGPFTAQARQGDLRLLAMSFRAPRYHEPRPPLKFEAL